MPDLPVLLSWWWFWLASGVLLGIAAALWLEELFPERRKAKPLQIVFDASDVRFLRPITWEDGERVQERMRVGILNNSDKTIFDVTLRTQEGDFVNRTIAHRHLHEGERYRDIIVASFAQLDPGAVEIVDVVTLDCLKASQLHAPWYSADAFCLEVRARDTKAVTQTFKFDPKRRPQVTLG